MAIVRQLEVQELLEEGAARAREFARDVVVSYVSKVDVVDPLAFFVAGDQWYRGTRTFWSDPVKEITLVSMGAACTIEAHGTNRFAEVENEWHTLCRDCVVDLQLEIKGTGPLLLGGFSFDPLAKKTTMWQNFPDARFSLPTFLLTVTDRGECWLTVNWVASARAKAKVPVEAERLIDLGHRLLMDAQAIDVSREVFIPLVNDYSYQEVEPGRWKRMVNEAARDIQCGMMEKVVLARELRIAGEQAVPVPSVLAKLSEEQPESFIFAFEQGEACFLGASPERLVQRNGDYLFTASVAGSIRRGKTATEDRDLGNWLLQDEKNLHEHQVVVKAIKQAMEAGCVKVDVPERPTLYKVRDIQHLFTPIVGQVRKDTTLLSMVEKLHPTPALGGYPKDVALREIRVKEFLDRGWYAAPVGWMDGTGNGDFAVAIRSGLIRGNHVSLFAGCGIMGDSNADSEYEETAIKFRPMLSALGGL